MFSSDQRFVITLNGEIYNFLELRCELEVLGTRFNSNTDTEVILEGWRHWGESVLERLNGMWAFALHDTISGETFLARDRFGVKPLFYTTAAGHLAFASEMRALTALSWLAPKPNERAIEQLLFDPFSIEGTEETLHESVRSLPAGYCATYANSKLAIRRWWNTSLHLPDVPKSDIAQQEKFRELFLDSVRLRMRSDVSIGTCLSGGFDSSAIVGAISHIAHTSASHQREAADWRSAFIASFPGSEYDETDQALLAARFAQAHPYSIEIRRTGALEDIDSVLEDTDGVAAGLATAPWCIYRKLRSVGTVVSLDGHGADELMGGYFQGGQRAGHAIRNFASGALSHWPALGPAMRCAQRLRLRRAGLDFLRRRLPTAPTGVPAPPANDRLPSRWGNLNRRLYHMFHCTVLPTILRNFDRMSMAHGVESRAPFLDWRLVTYTMALPDAAKQSAQYTKLIARHALTGLLPDEIRLNARKVGFNSPMPVWMNGALGDWALAALRRPHDAFQACVRTEQLTKRVRDLNRAQAWTWERTIRLWPYVNMNWYLNNTRVGS